MVSFNYIRINRINENENVPVMKGRETHYIFHDHFQGYAD